MTQRSMLSLTMMRAGVAQVITWETPICARSTRETSSITRLTQMRKTAMATLTMILESISRSRNARLRIMMLPGARIRETTTRVIVTRMMVLRTRRISPRRPFDSRAFARKSLPSSSQPDKTQKKREKRPRKEIKRK